MNPASEDVKDLLLAESSLALTFGTDLFISEIEESATEPALGVYDTGGPDRDLATDIEEPMVQIRVRGAKGGYLAAHEKLQAAATALHGQANITQGGARYLLIAVQTEVLFVGYDGNQRPMLTVNLRTIRTAA
jgi:hypothetical protein